MHRKNATLLLCMVVLLPACQLYHDTTARFNAYFLANEKMKEAETALFGTPQNQFHEIMDVLVAIDTNHTKSQKAAFDYVVEKASLPIQFHERSKWVPPCYLLIGKARLYQGDLGNALTTFKYVNAQSTDHNARHQALIWLLRIFLENREFNNFLYIKKVINAEESPFNEANTREYHLVMAQFNLLKEAYESASEHLALAVPLAKQRAKKARLYFILGQLSDHLGKTEQAYDAYAKARKLSPTFVLALYAEAGEKAARIPKSAAEEARRDQFYSRKIADDNNYDYRDKFYYDWADMKVARNNYPEAISLLNEAVQASTTNLTQKSLAYLRAGELYYALKKFEKASTYYDSAMQIMPQELKKYPATANRSEVLKMLVEQLAILKQQDKLLALAKLPEADAKAYFEKEIALEKENIIRFQEDKMLNKQKNQRLVPGKARLSSADKGKPSWYFYNPDLLVSGKSNFLRQWGSRPLTDYWRLSSKQAQATFRSGELAETQSTETDAKPQAEDIFATVSPIEERLAQLPNTPEKRQKAQEKIAEALFKLGNIYYYQLGENQNALHHFKRFIADFQHHKNAPEAAYTLYRLCKDYEACQDSTYKNYIIAHFPNSIYAKAFQDTNYLANLSAADAKVEKQYAKAYNYFKHGYFLQSQDLVGQINASFPEHSHKDKVALLAALLKAETQGKEAYQTALQNFLQHYPESKLLPYAKARLQKTGNHQKTENRQIRNETKNVPEEE